MKKVRYQFTPRSTGMSASIIREILKISSRPGMISFAGGLPAPEAFPLTQFGRAVSDTVRIDGTRALQYMVTEGHAGLKQYYSKWLRKQGVRVSPDQMLPTQGSQQGLDLIGRIFLSPGDKVLVEDPTYLGAIQCWNGFGAKYVTVKNDTDGMIPEELEKQLKKHRVKFIYVVPTFQNPSGITWSIERRKKLIELAKKYQTPIVEDDPYSVLRFKGKPVPAVYSLAKGKGVIYLTTFSKLLSPGIRLGYFMAEPAVMKHAILAKQAGDLQTNTFIQYAVYHYCQHGYLERHIPKIIQDYRHRANVMLEAIKTYFPKDVQYVEPEGGMFFWCILPKNLSASRVFKRAIQKKVAFVDGSVFYANGGGKNTMRLNFTNSTDTSIQTGIERLGRVISSF